jgi:S1-C subfamily serine protease
MRSLRNTLIFATLTLATTSPPSQVGLAQEAPKRVLDHIRSVSVSITVDGRFNGSGTLFLKGEETWCITAAHVTRGGKSFGITQPGPSDLEPSKIYLVAELVTEDKKKDVAILKIGNLAGHIFKDHANVCTCRPCKCNPCQCKKPALDTPIIHCGSMAGLHQTLTRGYLVGYDRKFTEETLCDQADMTGWYGSSGGGVFDTEGNYIGMLIGGISETCRIIYLVPIRTITQVLK